MCGELTTGEVHLLSVRHGYSLLGRVENRVRHEMEAIADRAGLKAILNTVLDSSGALVAAVYGDPRAAFRAGVAYSRQVYGVAVPAWPTSWWPARTPATSNSGRPTRPSTPPSCVCALVVASSWSPPARRVWR